MTCFYPEGLAPLGLPRTLSREPLRRLAPFAWLASLRSLASLFARLPGRSTAAFQRDASTRLTLRKRRCVNQVARRPRDLILPSATANLIELAALRPLVDA
jgi:hypothetical protein